ncbi:predicted protein [Plenodomus lingam JN3]|uniref:Predicted protein n=1 Tax=Leptosphaeria maculans (strain JN3 / isolate v23.1.3 / race Av1-4-5-6-7-8) TaxID=985895 RepID=E4ZS64_LEPMJ|nr:predicted protein [Plenodomus lingam JN3]CBX94244.1 predicted protein [Plenodomus lingam JN3]
MLRINMHGRVRWNCQVPITHSYIRLSPFLESVSTAGLSTVPQQPTMHPRSLEQTLRRLIRSHLPFAHVPCFTQGSTPLIHHTSSQAKTPAHQPCPTITIAHQITNSPPDPNSLGPKQAGRFENLTAIIGRRTAPLLTLTSYPLPNSSPQPQSKRHEAISTPYFHSSTFLQTSSPNALISKKAVQYCKDHGRMRSSIDNGASLVDRERLTLCRTAVLGSLRMSSSVAEDLVPAYRTLGFVVCGDCV